MTTLYDHLGHEITFSAEETKETKSLSASVKSSETGGIEYVRALLGIADKAASKARDPFSNHAYIYAAAAAIATNLSQVPVEVMAQTKGDVEKRRQYAIRRGIRIGLLRVDKSALRT